MFKGRVAKVGFVDVGVVVFALTWVLIFVTYFTMISTSPEYEEPWAITLLDSILFGGMTAAGYGLVVVLGSLIWLATRKVKAGENIQSARKRVIKWLRVIPLLPFLMLFLFVGLTTVVRGLYHLAGA